MLADFYIPRFSNNMEIAVQKNNLVGQIWYRSLVPSKNGVIAILMILMIVSRVVRERERFFNFWLFFNFWPFYQLLVIFQIIGKKRYVQKKVQKTFFYFSAPGQL